MYCISLCRHFNKLIVNEDFLELSTKEFVEIITNKQLNIESDAMLQQAVHRWVHHSPRERNEISSMVSVICIISIK